MTYNHGPWPGWRYRVGSLLVAGSPLLAIGISAGIHLAQAHFVPGLLSGDTRDAIAFVNAMLAATGAGSAGLFSVGSVGERLQRVFVGAVLGLLFYAVGWGMFDVIIL